MKISQMTNDEAGRALIALAAPIGRICDDEEAVALVTDYRRNVRGKPMFYVVGRILPRLVAHLFEHHKQDLYSIISILSGKNIDEISGMKLTETVTVLRESYDDVLKSFFVSSAEATQGGEGK